MASLNCRMLGFKLNTIDARIHHLSLGGLTLQPHALHRDPVHQPAVVGIVVEGYVPGGAIVPQGGRSRCPFEAIYVFGLFHVFEEYLE